MMIRSVTFVQAVGQRYAPAKKIPFLIQIEKINSILIPYVAQEVFTIRAKESIFVKVKTFISISSVISIHKPKLVQGTWAG